MPQPGASQLPAWHRLYVALAAFNIFTVLIALWYGSSAIADYRQSIALSVAWADRLESANVLSELASTIELIGHESVASGRIANARERINDAANRFQNVMDACTAGWMTDDPTLATKVRPAMARLESSLARLAAEADALVQIASDSAEEPPSASVHSAPDIPTIGLQHAQRDFTTDLSAFRGAIRDHVESLLKNQLARSESFWPVMYALGFAVLLMVSAATWYGRRLHRTLSHAERAINRNLRVAHAASRAKSDFLANMSHEIRTPMTSILGYAELLENPAQTDWRELVGIIRRNGQHLLAIINDILDLSKIEAGKMTTERLECSPIEIAREVHDLLAPRFTAKGLTLALRFGSALPASVQSDPLRLRQILLNLASNALKFTETGGAMITVSMQDEKDAATGSPHCRILFQVSDTGIGIAPSDLSRLFQPFTQSDTSTTRRFGGTGLGLSIARRFTRLLGGDLTASSNPGQGSTFTASIDPGPIDRSALIDPLASRAPAGVLPAPTVSAALHARILLADDGIDNRRLLTRFLQSAGAEVEQVENGRLAVDRALAAFIDGHPFDLILLDMQMPEMDGYTAAATLRGHGLTGPILALTAHAMTGERERCIDAGCSDYLTKPIPRQALVEACCRWLSAPAPARAAA